MPWKPKVMAVINKKPNFKSKASESDPLLEIPIRPGRKRLMRKSEYERLKARGELRSKLADSSVRTYFKHWKPVTLDHINVESEEPLTFNREQDLKDYCKKHNLQSGALL